MDTSFKPKKVWQIAEKKDSNLIRQILLNRSLKNPSDQERFLSPNFDRDFLDPFLLKDLKKAVDRLKLALKDNERIGLFGDYDADGLPATALMIKGLNLLGFDNIFTIIPTRDEGYGLNETTVKRFLEQKCSLIITIDNGITAYDAVEIFNKKNIDCIIIDHHIIQPELLPKAFAIINPKQDDCQYSDKFLTAGGLVYKTLWALFDVLGKETASLKWLLDLVAITTISDLAPLVNENRLLAYYGLIVLNKTKNLGLKNIIQQAAINKSVIDSYHVGFIISPRLNAISRMESEYHPEIKINDNAALRLLISNDPQECQRLAQYINQINVRRQANLEKSFQQAQVLASEQVKKGQKIIVIDHPDWLPGVVGLIAGKICESFRRPVFAFSHKDEYLIGSGRSIEQYHILEGLHQTNKILERYGGHAQAAGLTLDQKNLTDFIKILNSHADKILKEDDFSKTIKIEGEVALEKIDNDLLTQIQSLAPFGIENPQPIILVKGKVKDIRPLGGNGLHLSFYLINSNKKIRVIAFNQPQLKSELQDNQLIKLAAYLKLDDWNGNHNVQLQYIDHQTA